MFEDRIQIFAIKDQIIRHLLQLMMTATNFDGDDLFNISGEEHPTVLLLSKHTSLYKSNRQRSGL